MIAVSTTKMSSKGQVVIPDDVRKSLRLKTGDQFIVIGKGDAVILKAITPPSLSDFDDMLLAASKQAKAAGMKKHHIAEEIARYRKNK